MNNTGAGVLSVTGTLSGTTTKTESFTNSGTGSIVITNDLSQALNSLTLVGKVAYSGSASTVTTGITVNGATDDSNVSFTAVNGAGILGVSPFTVATDSFTLGNGVNTINDAGTGNITVVLGTNATGTDTVNLTGATTGSARVTVGTTATVGKVNVTVGNGLHNIDLGAGLVGSIQNVTVGTGGGTIDSTTLGSLTINATDVAGKSEIVTHLSASTGTTVINLGNGTDMVSDNGTGNITVTMGTNTSGTDVVNLSGASALGVTQSVTVGNGVHSIALGAGLVGSTQTVTVGTGGGVISSSTLGDITINSTDAAGNTENISVYGAYHSATINLGAGANLVYTGVGATTISVAAHTVADTFTVAANNSLTTLTAITGASTTVGDKLVIVDATSFNAVGITAANVAAATADVTTLAGWITGAFSANAGAGNAAHHSASWFNFAGNTYVVEQADAGNLAFGTGAAADTLVQLVGILDLSNGSISGSTITL